ncbi:MAG: hypothetical protein H7222_08340 [Methylotenera sp.]|nr:hypothetical protein [Oligoflexia bacterium]
MKLKYDFSVLASLCIPLLLVALSGSGCSSASLSDEFEKVMPEMTTQEVTKAMKTGPSRFEAVDKTDYASWYWGNDYCVLFKGGKVVGKNSSAEGKSASVGPGKYEEKNPAQCLAPGQVAESGADRSINIPGIGTIKLPKRELTRSAH